KGSNFLVFKNKAGQMVVKLIDFGLATREGEYYLGIMNMMTGSLGHMSVNQLEGRTAKKSDDLYGLLTTFKEMIVGTPIWHMNPHLRSNHIDLYGIQGFGTYPVF